MFGISTLLGLGGLKLKLILMGIGVAVALFVVYFIFRKGQESAEAKFLKKSMEVVRAQIKIKEKQAAIAANRPSRDEFERMLRDGDAY